VVIIQPTRAGPDRETIPPASPRVLLIDRQPLFLEVIRRLLAAPPLNADVAVATRSDAAVELARQTSVDLVICDVRAEPVAGPELAGMLATRCPQVRVILLADGDDKPVLVGALLSGAAGFFAKDTAEEEFVEGVLAVLHGYFTVGHNLMQQTLAKLAGKGDSRQPLSQLSATEHSILVMIGEAQSIRTIAGVRGISQKTVRNHLGSIYRKLHLRNRTEAILWAARMGLTHPREA
jgi:DNA-binding NarL/FixJ family response regulator